MEHELINIYVVNFCDEARRSRMEQRLSSLGLSPHFVDPVYIADERLNLPGLENTHKRNASIMLQHLDSLQHFLESTKSKYCIVCEDDILILKNLVIDFPSISAKFDELELDVLLMGYLCPYEINPDWNRYYPRLSRDEKYQYTGYPDDLWGAQMYMVSRDHAKLLLEMYAPTSVVANDASAPYNPDWTLTKKGKRALIYPMVAIEEADSNKSGSWGECEFHRRCHEQNYVEGAYI